jgi:hypothetical protein
LNKTIIEMKKGFLYLFAATMLISCGGEETQEEESTGGGSIIGNPNPEEGGSINSNGNSDGQSGDEDAVATTSIEYFDLKHNFGNVFYPSDNKFTFKFKNTGEAPLIIDQATASCGCTIPNKPEEPILPGEIGELDVIFRPKSGQVGQDVTKKITVVANTNPKETYLEITAKVLDAM